MTLILLDPFRIPAASGPVYDPDAQAMFDARAALGDDPSAPYKLAISNYVTALKAVSGLWGAITQLVVPAGATTIAGALISIKGNNFTGANMANGDVAPKSGIKGNGTNKSLSTGYSGNFTGSSQNSLHIYTYITEVPTVSPAVLCGNGGASIGRTGIAYNSSTACRAQSTNTHTVTGAGDYGVNRSSSGSYQRMLAGATSTVTQASQASNSGTFLVLARGGNANATPELWSNHRFLVYAMGGGISTLADYTTPTADLVAALNAI